MICALDNLRLICRKVADLSGFVCVWKAGFYDLEIFSMLRTMLFNVPITKYVFWHVHFTSIKRIIYKA